MTKRSVYLTIRDTIADKLAAYAVDDDGRLPSERLLCQTLNVSRSTIRSSLQALEDEGLIFRIGRGGWYVSPPKLALPLGTFWRFADIAEQADLIADVQPLAVPLPALLKGNLPNLAEDVRTCRALRLNRRLIGYSLQTQSNAVGVPVPENGAEIRARLDSILLSPDLVVPADSVALQRFWLLSYDIFATNEQPAACRAAFLFRPDAISFVMPLAAAQSPQSVLTSDIHLTFQEQAE